MEQILSVTTQKYFQKVHKIEIDSGNALELLAQLKEFEKIHLAYKDDYESFRGLTFESIEEHLAQALHRIVKTHEEYVSKGYLLTQNTKQAAIEDALKVDVNRIVKDVITSIETPIELEKTVSSQEIAKSIGLKYALKRAQRHKKE